MHRGGQKLFSDNTQTTISCGELPKAKVLLGKLTDLIDYLIPLYEKEGKSQLVIAFGCTGGKHRSVTFAEAVAEHLRKQGHRIRITHRDINNQ